MPLKRAMRKMNSDTMAQVQVSIKPFGTFFKGIQNLAWEVCPDRNLRHSVSFPERRKRPRQVDS